MHITVGEVQAWFQGTRLTVTESEIQAFELVATTTVFSALSRKYTTTSWLNQVSTPDIVRAIISMFVAAWVYQRSYSDNADLSSYGTWLEGKAYHLLEAAANGDLLIPGLVPDQDLGFNVTDFFPNEDSPGPYIAMDSTF